VCVYVRACVRVRVRVCVLCARDAIMLVACVVCSLFTCVRGVRSTLVIY
jgi:hypothetical protein